MALDPEFVKLLGLIAPAILTFFGVRATNRNTDKANQDSRTLGLMDKFEKRLEAVENENLELRKRLDKVESENEVYHLRESNFIIHTETMYHYMKHGGAWPIPPDRIKPLIDPAYWRNDIQPEDMNE